MAQLEWQCRRGMRELDELLLRFLKQHYPLAQSDEKTAFRSLLTLPDPELIRYLLGQDEPPVELQIVVQKIRRGTDT